MRAVALAVLLFGSAASAAAQPILAPPSSTALLDELEASWNARDSARYLALWSFPAPAARADEESFARTAFDTGAGKLVIERPSAAPATPRLRVVTRFVAIQEPRARVEQYVFVLEESQGAWHVTARDPVGRIDGLVHLSLDPRGYRADGLTLKLEDFELRMQSGTLFLAPEALGPTVAVFVGEATVMFTPRPDTEKEQLRQFAGKTELRDGVKAAFVRIHPADLTRVLQPMRLERDPQAPTRLAAAREYFDEQAPRAFVLDATLPGAPWWVLPGVGDALVSFDYGKQGTLTFAVNQDQPESINLFNRTKRQQLCLYPRDGRTLRYSDDDGRDVDILHHDLKLRFEPLGSEIVGEDTLTLRLLEPVTTLRLKLDDSLRVDSVTSAEAGRHLFFRVRHQDTLMVSLGGLAGLGPEVRLTVRFSGRLPPVPVENELLQFAPYSAPFIEEGPPVERVDVYSNRNAFYPQGHSEDYATATLHLDVPAGMSALTGGQRLSSKTENGRNVTEYQLTQPGKYLTVAVGRFVPVGERRVGNVMLTGYGLGRTRSETARSLDQAEDMLRLYTELFGPCPYDRINLAVIEGQLPGGHSPPGMLVVARRPAFVRRALRDDPTNFSDVPGFFLAHELAHQWWGHGVAGQNYRERWLSEGFAQYAAALWTQRAHGEEEFQGVLNRMGRWAMRKSEWGPISLGYRLGHIKGDAEAFRALVYDKAAYVLHMLRGLIGAEAFGAALIDVQSRFRYQKAGTDDVREAFERAADRPLAGYFQQWIYGTAVPELSFAQRSQRVDGVYRVVIDVKARELAGPLPLQLTVFHPGGRVNRRVTLPAEGGSFTLDSKERPIRVEINADRGLLAKVEGP